MNVRGNPTPIRNPFNELGSHLGSILKVLQPAYIIAAVPGYILLRMFTIKAHVPMPDADGSLVVVVAICGLVCLLGAAWLVMIPLMPMWLVYNDVLFLRLVPPLDRYPASDSREWIYAKRFVWVFLPYIIATMAFPIAVTYLAHVHPDAYKDQQTSNRYFNGALIGSGCLGVVVALISQGFYWATGQVFAVDVGRPKCLSFLLTSLFSSSFLWLGANAFVFLGLIIGIRERFISESAPTYTMIFFYLATVLWHCSSMSFVLWKRYDIALFLSACIYVFLIIFLNGQLGALSLRITGIGGGIPVSGYFRIVDPDSPSLAVYTKRFSGCLVLRTGTKTVIQRPVDDFQAIRPCHLNPRTPIAGNSGKIIKVEIDTINNSDLIELQQDDAFPKP